MQTVNDNNEEFNIDLKIIELLAKYGVTQTVKIDEGSEMVIYQALTKEDIDKVYVDEEGGLCIEYYGFQDNQGPAINGTVDIVE